MEDATPVRDWLTASTGEATDNGRYLVLAYAFPPGEPNSVTLITTSRRYFGDVAALFAEEYPLHRLSLGRALDPTQADKLTTLHRGVRAVRYKLPAFDSQDANARKLVGDLLAEISPSHWYARGFLLFDICDFSSQPTADQVSLRLLLDASIRAARTNLVKNWRFSPEEAEFNQIPTGDGFYVWHRRASRHFDSITLALGALTLADLKRPRWRGLDLKVRAALAVDEVYTLPYRALSPSTPLLGVFQDAIGRAPNAAARLCGAAAPNQFLISDFSHVHLGDTDELRSAEQLVKAAVMLFPGNTEGFKLHLEPSDRLKVIDKHGDAYYCFNICGEAFFYTGPTRRTTKIGVVEDTVSLLSKKRFVDY